MGISIYLMKKNGKEKYLDAAWRSMFYSLLTESFQTLHLTDYSLMILEKKDISELKHLKIRQRKGEKEPPFDWAPEIAKCFDLIIEEINKNGEAKVKFEC